MSKPNTEAGFVGVRSAKFFSLAIGMLRFIGTVFAVPRFARQTGQESTACHTVCPLLTPQGCHFKPSGYSLRSPKAADASSFDKVPISGLLIDTRGTATVGATGVLFLI